MYTKNVLAVSGAFLSVVAAVPMAKRDVVWVTEIKEDVVTMPVTTTVWVTPGEATPTSSDASHFGHHRHSQVTSYVQSTVTVSAVTSSSEESSAEPTSAASSSEAAPSSSSVYVAPTTSSVYVAPTTSSVYVAPTTSSTSVYVAPTTSSVYVAPTTSSTSVYVAPTTTSVYVAPTPTSTYVAPTTTSAAPAATSSAAAGVSSGSGASGTTYTGDMTWYDVGLGACGLTSSPSDHIVAISESIFDSYTQGGNPNNNPLCGKSVTITGVDGTARTATIVDRCTGCAAADLDLSADFFNLVTDNGDGRVHNVKWKFD